jgi:hypothetical protein
LAVLLWTVAPTPARAGGIDESVLDDAALAGLQQRADRAQPRDQCILYTELVHALTERAGRQMAAGDDESAAVTISQVDIVAAKIEKSATHAKQLKNAEQLLEHTTHRLTDMARVAADQQRALMQTTLRHLDAVHSSVLALVFAE